MTTRQSATRGQRHLISASDAVRLLLATFTGTAIASLILSVLPPGKGSGGGGLLRDVHLPSGALPQILVIALCVIAIALLQNFPRKLGRSVELGLMNSVDWVWAPAVAVSWLAHEYRRDRVTIASLACALALSGITRLFRRREGQRGQNESSPLEPDLPVLEGGEDLLGRGELIESVVSTILLQPPPIIAVTGRYGDGKTSFLNLAIGEINGSSEIEAPIIVRFGPWLAADSNALVLSLLNSIVATIKLQLLVPGLSGDAARYARTLLSAVPWTERLKDLIGEPSQEERIDALVSRIAAVRRRVLVVLDDLDRMEAKELETVFKLLRGSDKLSNVTFLCAFDKSEVALILQATRPKQQADTFIEKFFPVEFRLPEIDSVQLRNFFTQRIGRTLERSEAQHDDLTKGLEEAWDSGLGLHFLNLRKIKVFFNRISRSLEFIAEEVNVLDFVRLELVRDIAPSVYGLIFRHYRYFWEGGLAFEIWTKTPEPYGKDEGQKWRAEFYKGRVDPLVGDRPELVQLLSELFPRFAAYRQGSKPGVGNSANAEKDKRIFHPRYFWQYFRLKVPSQLFSQKEFRTFASSLEHINEEDVAQRFSETFRSIISEDFKRWHFMDSLENRFGEFDLRAKKGLCRGMAMNSALWQLDAFELLSAVRCTRGTLAAISDRGVRRELLQQIVLESESDLYSLILLWRLEDIDKEAQQKLMPDLQDIRAVLRDHLRSHYLRPDAPSVFEQYGVWGTGANRIEPIQFLFSWGHLCPDAESDARQYLLGLLRRRPSELNSFLSSMFRVDFIDDYTTLKSLIDYKELSELVTLNESILEPGRVLRFRERYDAESARERGERED
jgi:hypothetical protein